LREKYAGFTDPILFFREMVPGRTNRKLPTYSADEKEEVDDWIQAVEVEARAVGWDDNVADYEAGYDKGRTERSSSAMETRW
jgi:hypothetical protein